jgi:hypothetical protein
MKRQPVRLILPVLMFAAVAAALAAPKDFFQHIDVPHQAWDAGTRYPGWQAPSTLTLVNDCKKTHTFSVTKSNAGFLDFDFTSPVTVPGQSTVTKPVHFHTDGMEPGDYTGEVTVICLDCTEVPPCTQDHKYLAPHIVVIARQVDNPPLVTHDDCQRDCNEILKRYEEVQAQVKTQQAIFDKAKSAFEAARANAADAERNVRNAVNAALANFDVTKAAALQLTAEQAQKDFQLAIDKFNAALADINSAFGLLEGLKDQAQKLLKEFQTCLAETAVCKQEGPPKKCTPDDPCTDGWNPCGPGQVCGGPPEK